MIRFASNFYFLFFGLMIYTGTKSTSQLNTYHKLLIIWFHIHKIEREFQGEKKKRKERAQL